MAEGGREKRRVLEMVEMKDVRNGGGAVVPCFKFSTRCCINGTNLPFKEKRGKKGIHVGRLCLRALVSGVSCKRRYLRPSETRWNDIKTDKHAHVRKYATMLTIPYK